MRRAGGEKWGVVERGRKDYRERETWSNLNTQFNIKLIVTVTALWW